MTPLPPSTLTQARRKRGDGSLQPRKPYVSGNEKLREALRERAEAQQADSAAGGGGADAGTCSPETKRRLSAYRRRLLPAAGLPWEPAARDPAAVRAAEAMDVAALAAETSNSADATWREVWQDEWRERVSCWWLELPGPTQEQLGSCIGALSLHIGSRLDAVLGRSTRVAATAATQAGCEWVEHQSYFALPDFPEPGVGGWHQLEMWLPPIPRLLPSWPQLQQLQQLQSQLSSELYLSQEESGSTRLTFGAREEQNPSWSAAVGGGGAVLTLSAGLLLWRCLGHLYRRNIACRLSFRRFELQAQ